MQCKAKSKGSGKRCKKNAIKGGAVCRSHGGAAPQVKLKAQERLAILVDPAIDRLKEVIEKGENIPAAVTAARDILDRTGFKATDKLEVKTEQSENAVLLSDIFTLEELKEMEARIERHMAAGQPEEAARGDQAEGEE